MKIRTEDNKKAIVIGGSIAGLLAARVLSDNYEHVTIIERDDLPQGPSHRRGVPHGRHAHALLAGGQRVLENLFPGITGELIERGALPADPLNDGIWFFEGAPLRRIPTGTTGALASRPLLESVIRKKVGSIDNVSFLTGRGVRALATDENCSRINGVVMDDGHLPADLVVDATGRGSKSAAWLKSLGYRPAREEKVGVDLVYTTRLFRPTSEGLHDSKFIVVAPTPEGKRGGVIGMQENNQWIVTLFGHFGNIPPDELDGYIEYARSLPSPLIFNAIRSAEPLSEPVTFRFPASTRRRYEELDRFPEAFVVFGDAICSFNPIYGQGMSVAALQAEALSDVLRAGQMNVGLRFFRTAARVIDNPWSIAVGADLRMPETVGSRNVGVKLVNWYIANVHKQSHTDPVAAAAFNRVSQLLDPPTALMRPRMISRVLGGTLRRKFSVRAGGEQLLTTAEPRQVASDGF